MRQPWSRRVALALLGLPLFAAGCGNGPAASSPPALVHVPEPSGAYDAAVAGCTAAAGGRYAIEVAYLPPDADQQREQPVRRLAAVRGGLLPTTEVLYDDPAVRAAFPSVDLLRETLRDAAPRPQTPAYNDVSLAIQRVPHPPRRIDPAADVERLRARVDDAVHSRGLL